MKGASDLGIIVVASGVIFLSILGSGYIFTENALSSVGESVAGLHADRVQVYAEKDFEGEADIKVPNYEMKVEENEFFIRSGSIEISREPEIGSLELEGPQGYTRTGRICVVKNQVVEILPGGC